MRKLIAGLAAGCSPLSLSAPPIALGLALSLIAPLYFGGVTLIYTTTAGPIVQDDARLHVVWLQRLVDPALFPQDAIATYYTAIQSAGFQAVYGLGAALGIAPLTLAKILPLGLALIATVYLFWVALLILPVPLSGLLVTLIFNQNIWLKDDLVSATPRAFVYPLFAAFLYYLMRGAGGLYLLTLGLLGLFYPQMMLVALGLLTLRLLGQMRSPSQRWKRGALWLLGLGLTLGLLLTFSYRTEAQVGPLVSLDDMRAMPEFQAAGRRPYFGVSPLNFAFAGASGLRLPLFPPVIGAGLLLPVLAWKRRWGTSQMTEQAAVLVQLLASALALFLLAHAVFPRLYLPSRYTFYSLRFLMAIASGLLLTLAIQQAIAWLAGRAVWTWGDRGRACLGGALAIAIAFLPAVPAIFLPCHGWVVGQTPGLYRAINAYRPAGATQTPEDTLVASIVPQVNNVPAFAQRSVLVGEEFALPYHSEFYDLMRRRMADLVAAQYSPEPAELAAFIQAYGIGLWLVDQDFAKPNYLMQQDWLIHSAIGGEVVEVVQKLQQGSPLALAQSVPTCSIFSEANLILLDAACIAKQSK